MAVYNYHESRYGDEDMVDIYSLEWRQRIASWHELFTQAYGTKHAHKDIVET